MARARLAALPVDHPASVAWQASRLLQVPTWETASAALGNNLLKAPVQIDLHPLFAGAPLAAARMDPGRRRDLLARYRWEVLRPALVEYDRQAFRRPQ